MKISFDLDGVLFLYNDYIRSTLKNQFNMDLKGNIDINFLNSYPLPDKFKTTFFSNYVFNHKFILNKQLIKTLHYLKEKHHSVLIITNREQNQICGKAKKVLHKLLYKQLINDIITKSNKFRYDAFKINRLNAYQIHLHIDDDIILLLQILNNSNIPLIHFSEESNYFTFNYNNKIYKANNKNIINVINIIIHN